jgi:hypothetical protein
MYRVFPDSFTFIWRMGENKNKLFQQLIIVLNPSLWRLGLNPLSPLYSHHLVIFCLAYLYNLSISEQHHLVYNTQKLQKISMNTSTASHTGPFNNSREPDYRSFQKKIWNNIYTGNTCLPPRSNNGVKWRLTPDWPPLAPSPPAPGFRSLPDWPPLVAVPLSVIG